MDGQDDVEFQRELGKLECRRKLADMQDDISLYEARAAERKARRVIAEMVERRLGEYGADLSIGELAKLKRIVEPV